MRRWALLLILGLATVAGLLAVAALSGHYEVLAKGQLLPYTEARVYRVRFFDRFDLWVEPEHRPSADALTAYFLTGLAFVSLAFAWLLHRLGDRRTAPMFALMFLGGSYLAADEYLGLHESIGHNLQFLATLPGVKRPDDVVIALYTVPAALFAWAYRRPLSISRPALTLLAGGAVLFVTAALADLASAPGEELLEVGAAFVILLAVAETGLAHVLRSLRARAS